jgi:hypothetical protein
MGGAKAHYDGIVAFNNTGGRQTGQASAAARARAA